MESDRLFCSGGGCTAKLGPGALQRVLERLPRADDDRLLVGFDRADDAAVYRLTDGLAVVQTLDFFPPMVEDPYLFGQIAAANAMSDVYAMGGDVRTALNIVCFPEAMDLNVLGRILQGGCEKVQEAGGVLAGGHSIVDDGVKYGLSVMGVVDPRRIWQNGRCEPGDALLLTKPLGVGIVCTAARMGEADSHAMAQAVQSMTALNRAASEALRRWDVHACTDVTGFGFLAHLCELLGERMGAQIVASAVPCIPEALAYAEEFYITAAGQRNRNHVGERVRFEGVSFGMEEVLFDPQTSGGLLAALPMEQAEAALAELRALGLCCGIVGRVTEGARIVVQA